MNIATTFLALVASFTMGAFGSATAAVSAQEAAQLKTTLTPLGAIRAGSKDGMIPAWTGGMTKVPDGYKNGEIRPDFFANEKPLYVITQKDMDKYADRLTDGEKALLQKYPDFKMEIYPTHRTAAAPDWVYANTFKNATRAELTPTDGVAKAYGGVPFPILDKDPDKAGKEAFWNGRLAWTGTAYTNRYRAWEMVNQGTQLVLATGGWQTFTYPYYDPKGDLATFKGYWAMQNVRLTEPTSASGQAIMTHEPMDYLTQSRQIWQYLVGQRRVRRAPALRYDTPDFVVSGQGFFDEAFMAYGPFDEYQFKLVGEKEIYVPYNNNRADVAPINDLFKPHFMNPDLVRLELHRVWVVSATLKAGRRHVNPSRLYYLDEDTWQILLIDSWDSQKKLVQENYSLTLLAPDVPTLTNQVCWGGYNFQSWDYYINECNNSTGGALTPQFKILPLMPEDHFSPSYLANQQLQ